MDKCNTLIRRRLLPKRKTCIKSANSNSTQNRHDNTSIPEASPKPIFFPDEVEDSIWLCDILNTIGVNDVFRKARHQTGIMTEILHTFQESGVHGTTGYNMGSIIEGTNTPDESTDIDFLRCLESVPVMEDILNCKKSGRSLLIVREFDTPPGYVKLQLVEGGLPCTSKHWNNLSSVSKSVCKTDRMERIVLFGFNEIVHLPIFSRPKNKPAVRAENYYGFTTDTVISYRCTTWPTMADEWLIRRRVYGWPAKDAIEEMKSFGFFVVRKGHPFSPEIDLEWRISFSLQERKLMFNLTNVQHKCYVVLKMLNKDVINFDCITTYHWKTCLFYVIEENNTNIWKKKHILYCIKLCIRQMLKCVKHGVCPNYFIPGENLFDGKLDSSWRLISENILEEMLNVGIDCLLFVRRNHMCDYLRFRENLECFQCLQVNSTKVYKEALHVTRINIIQTAISVFNERILGSDYYEVNGENSSFIKSLWLTLDRIEITCDENIPEHTAQEIQNSLYLLLPHIYTCLASSISAMAIQIPTLHTRDFLLFGGCMYFMNSNLSGFLKFISVLHAAELYSDCEWWIDKLDEKYIKFIPSVCNCRFIKIDSVFEYMNSINTSQLHVSSCVTFLPTELSITPDALKYEMFRYVGIPLDKNRRPDQFRCWHYRAVIDSNVYFFLLKYLIKRKLGRVQEYKDAKSNILDLLHGTNVRHDDVAYNVFAWISYSELNTPEALLSLLQSWKIMTSSDLCYMILTEIKKRAQYLYNAAKIHALVILYNTWFAKKLPSVHFCFQCFGMSDSKLLRCSSCKISTYCSKQCQIKNWKIHKVTCRLIRKNDNP